MRGFRLRKRVHWPGRLLDSACVGYPSGVQPPGSEEYWNTPAAWWTSKLYMQVKPAPWLVSDGATAPFGTSNFGDSPGVDCPAHSEMARLDAMRTTPPAQIPRMVARRHLSWAARRNIASFTRILDPRLSECLGKRVAFLRTHGIENVGARIAGVGPTRRTGRWPC